MNVDEFRFTLTISGQHFSEYLLKSEVLIKSRDIKKRLFYPRIGPIDHDDSGVESVLSNLSRMNGYIRVEFLILLTLYKDYTKIIT